MATQDYVLNGTTTFTFPFAVRSASLLTLELVPGGVVSTGDYTVTGAGPTSTGVTVTYPDAPTSTTTVLRITRYVQPNRITTLNGPSDITVANLNAEFDNAYDAIADFQISGVNLAQAVTDAEAAATAAEAAAASVNLPVIAPGDAGKVLQVNSGETAFELTATLAANTVATTSITDGAVTTAKLADSATTTAKLADAAVTAAKLAAVIHAPVLVSSTAITAVTNIDLPTVFSDNSGYEYFKIVIEGFGNSTIGNNLITFSDDGSTFGVSDTVNLLGNYTGSIVAYAAVLVINANSATNHKVARGHVSDLEAAGGGSGDTAVSQVIADSDALTGFRFSSGGFRAVGTLKVYGCNAPF